jgi:N-methylhydantoinase A
MVGAGADGADVAAVSHGTTVATNALLEDDIEHMGLITTEGYRYVLEIARQSVPEGYGNSYFWVKPDRIVPVDRVREVGGRLDVRGHEVRPLDEEGAAEVARWYRDRGIDTLGVCLLHSYANDDHERRLLEIIRREHPDATVSLSSEVLREYREYERTITTLVDASVKPRVGRYIRGIAERLAAFTGGAAAPEVDRDTRPGWDGGGADGSAVNVPFYIMKSNGGVLSAEEVVHQPITTVLSGPAAGALGAALVAGEAGYDRILTCDGGGTSTDVSVVLGGEPTLTTEGTIGRFPSKIPMIDIVTVGAGGGSIAWISPEGNLKVGPRSAGAHPGPLCYATGGTEPTVTDAHVSLGRIPPHLLGGEIPLDVEAARTGIDELAGRLGLAPADAARGILEISAWNQANAIRQVTVKRGVDVRDFAMVAFGGSGPLLICRLIDILGLRAVVVPLDPGNLSALGLLTVDVKNDYVQTHVVRDDGLDRDEVAAVYATLEARAAARSTARASRPRTTASPAPPTCATTVRRSRCGCRRRRVRSTPSSSAPSSTPSTTSTSASTATATATPAVTGRAAVTSTRSSGSTSGSAASARSSVRSCAGCRLGTATRRGLGPGRGRSRSTASTWTRRSSRGSGCSRGTGSWGRR